MSVNRRQKLSDAQMNEIRAMLSEGGQVEAVAMAFGISTTHVYRIQAALRSGAINLKPTSLNSCLEHVKNGLPFRRVAWSAGLYFYYDTKDSWFVRHVPGGDHGDDYEVIEYVLCLRLEDLLAKDWIVMTWDAVE